MHRGESKLQWRELRLGLQKWFERTALPIYLTSSHDQISHHIRISYFSSKFYMCYFLLSFRSHCKKGEEVIIVSAILQIWLRNAQNSQKILWHNHTQMNFKSQPHQVWHTFVFNSQLKKRRQRLTRWVFYKNDQYRLYLLKMICLAVVLTFTSQDLFDAAESGYVRDVQVR